MTLYQAYHSEVINIIVLYSTGCPKCKILKQKLKQKGITYEENNSVDEMLNLGLTNVPVLKVEDKMLVFSDAIKWIDNGGD